MTTPAQHCPPAGAPPLSMVLQKFLRELNASVEATTVKGRDADARKTDYEFLSKSAGEIVQVIAAYEKAFPQLLARHDALKAIAESTATKLEENPEVAAKADTIKKKAADLQASLDAAENEVTKAAEELHKQTKPFNGARLSAEYAENEFKQNKAELKTWDDRLKAWEGLKDLADKSAADRPVIAYVYIQVLIKRLERPLTTPDRLRTILINSWHEMHKQRAIVREAKVPFDTAQADDEEKKKNFASLQKSGVDDIIRDLELMK